MKIINLTPHEVVFQWGKTERQIVHIPASGNVARVSVEYEEVGNIDGFRLVRTKYGKVQGMPEPDGKTWYVVSKMVKYASPDRDDVISPEDFVRDEKGNIIACRAWDIS